MGPGGKTLEPIYNRLYTSQEETEPGQPSLDIPISQIDSCRNWWSEKIGASSIWLMLNMDVSIGRSGGSRARFRLSLIKNDPPGASSQRAVSHSGEISQVPSVFLEKNNRRRPKDSSIFTQLVCYPYSGRHVNALTQGLACCKSSQVKAREIFK